MIKPCGPEELCANVRQAAAHKLVLDRCRLLLPLFRRQANILQAVERRSPGLIRSVEAEFGTIIADWKIEDVTTAEDLSERMDVVIRQADQRLSGA